MNKHYLSSLLAVFLLALIAYLGRRAYLRRPNRGIVVAAVIFAAFLGLLQFFQNQKY